MGEEDDYSDEPRSSRRPMLSEREPDPAPLPVAKKRVSVRLVNFTVLNTAGFLALRLTGDHPAVGALAQPWRFLAQAAVFVGWLGILVMVDWWMGRAGYRPAPTTG